MPDGFDRRPTTGDRPPARRATARSYDEDTDFDTDPYDDDPYQDDYEGAYDDPGSDDNPDRGPGKARRFANWLGFGAPSGTENEPDLYGRRPDDEDDLYDSPPGVPPVPDEPPPAPPRTPPGSGVPDARTGSGDAYDETSSYVPADAPRRTRASSPWEDIMLGSGPPPGTPMSDALPTGTLPSDAPALRDSGSPSKQATRGGAVSDWLDPMDPVDPLDPRDPTGTPDPAHDDEDGSEPPTEGDGHPVPVIPPPAPAGSGGDGNRPSAPRPQAEQQNAEPRDFEEDGPEPRRMLRLLPTPVLADGGGMVVDGGRVERLTVRAAAVRGDLHTQNGTPRQNSFAVGPDPSGRWTISIVCDGIDGGYAAELASQVALRSAYRAVARMVTAGRHEDWDWTTTLDTVRTELRSRLADITTRARTLGRPAPATRLAVLVTSTEPLQDDRVDMAVLGDSTILRLSEGGWRAPLGIRETPAALQPPALPEHGTEHVRVCRTTWRPSDALVVMTGGFADALGAGSGGLAARLAEDWRRPPELLEFLRDVSEGSHTDDGAVVALWPEP